MADDKKDLIGCRDECGRKVASPEEAEAKAWRMMEVSRGWRCPECARALAEVNARSSTVELGYGSTFGAD